MLQSVLRIEPCGMKLSDWRNIAYHHTYALRDDGNIDCTYGKGNINNIRIYEGKEEITYLANRFQIKYF